MAVTSRKKDILLESGTNELELIEFTIADRHFGINVSKVEEILRYEKNITPMPHSNRFVEGVFKPRESIITVIDLASYLGLPQSTNPGYDIMIVTNFNMLNSAFHVHTVEDIHRISWSDIEKPDAAIYGGESGVATGIARFEERLITIIDFEKIIADISPAASIKTSDVEVYVKRDRIKKPIMVAEDSPLLEKMILDCLDRAGYVNIIACTNGLEAWEKLNELKKTKGAMKEKCSLLVTDIEMPKMDGHRLLRLVREDKDWKNLPVVVFSSLINEQMYQKGESLGATAQISKPEIGKLVGLIDKHIL
ncbi:MAG: chemotaxis protein [Clostridiales bacterium]|jgi:two-component system chemotaxis response regulator CheV|nr:chemotaxis protein [Clostridiales bacterium]